MQPGNTMADMAGQAKQYLDQVFQDQPAALRKVQEAYDQETSQHLTGRHKPSTRHWLSAPLAWVLSNRRRPVMCLLQAPGSTQTLLPRRDRQSMPP